MIAARFRGGVYVTRSCARAAASLLIVYTTARCRYCTYVWFRRRALVADTIHTTSNHFLPHSHYFRTNGATTRSTGRCTTLADIWSTLQRYNGGEGGWIDRGKWGRARREVGGGGRQRSTSGSRPAARGECWATCRLRPICFSLLTPLVVPT